MNSLQTVKYNHNQSDLTLPLQLVTENKYFSKSAIIVLLYFRELCIFPQWQICFILIARHIMNFTLWRVTLDYKLAENDRSLLEETTITQSQWTVSSPRSFLPLSPFTSLFDLFCTTLLKLSFIYIAVFHIVISPMSYILSQSQAGSIHPHPSSSSSVTISLNTLFSQSGRKGGSLISLSTARGKSHPSEALWVCSQIRLWCNLIIQPRNHHWILSNLPNRRF